MSTDGMNNHARVHGMEHRLDRATAGARDHWPPKVPHLMMHGAITTPAEVQNHLTELARRWKEVREAHKIIRQFAQDKPRLTEEARKYLQDLDGALSGAVGSYSEVLTHFGFTPMKPRKKLTVEKNALKAAKAKMTREKRGTKGKRQREAIRAEDVEVMIDPETKKMRITETGDGDEAPRSEETGEVNGGGGSNGTEPSDETPTESPSHETPPDTPPG